MGDTTHDHGKGKLTGRHVAMIFVGFFGTIFAVNGFMAYMAVGTFPGLEARNGFAESQTFEARRDAQEALGWDVAASVQEGVLAIVFTDSSGAPVEVASMEAIVGKATSVSHDMTPRFAYREGTFSAPLDLGPGNWNIRLTAHAPDGTLFARRVVLRVN